MPDDNTVIVLIKAGDLLVTVREWANGKFVEQVEGKGLSANDFTDALLAKLNAIEAGAEVNEIVGVSLNNVPILVDGNRVVNIDLSDYATKADISSVYIASGDIQASALVASLLVEVNLGHVYNLTDTLVITNANVGLFKNATVGQSFPAGSNVAIIKDGNNYLFDMLAGLLDLSGYYTKSEVNNLLEGKANTIHTHVFSDITDVSFMTQQEALAILEASESNN